MAKKIAASMKKKSVGTAAKLQAQFKAAQKIKGPASAGAKVKKAESDFQKALAEYKSATAKPTKVKKVKKDGQKKDAKKILKALLTGPRKFSKHGQHMPIGSGCISTSLAGKPCPHDRDIPILPYCKQCRRTGDPSLLATDHPKFGKILIARRALKAPYHAAWWGTLTSAKKIKNKNMEWALSTTKGMIDAVPHKGSLLQFAACPGPSEVPTVDLAPNEAALLTKADKTCLLFKTLRDIPKNHQVTMMYNEDEKSTDEFFRERGLTRADVGTRKHPALRKKRAGPAP